MKALACPVLFTKKTKFCEQTEMQISPILHRHSAIPIRAVWISQAISNSNSQVHILNFLFSLLYFHFHKLIRGVMHFQAGNFQQLNTIKGTLLREPKSFFQIWQYHYTTYSAYDKLCLKFFNAYNVYNQINFNLNKIICFILTFVY